MTIGYREEESSVFECNGSYYSLNKLFEQAEHLPVQHIEVLKLRWVLNEMGPLDAERVARADTTVPLLVTLYMRQELVVDGAHRLQKAVNEELKTLPYYRLTPKMMHAALVKPTWSKW